CHIATQQAALDNDLVPSKKRLKIERCNARIAFSKPQREETYQVTLEALKLSPCYPAFLITAEVPEIYMHQFWITITKIRDIEAYKFVALPSEEELLSFIKELGYSGNCISGKTTGRDRLRESRAQILWCMYNKKNVDYVALLWEDFMYQADNREISSARKEHMPYPRFTKVIINHFISKDKTISMRNMINLHTIRDDSLLGSIRKLLHPHENYLLSKKRNLSRRLKELRDMPRGSTTAPTIGVVIRDTPGVYVSKKKAPAKVDRSKGIEILSDVALSEAAQLKEATKRSKKDFHISQASGLGNGTNFKSGVPDELQRKTSGIDEGTGTKPGVPDVPKYHSESDDESWGDNEDDNNDDSDDFSKGDDDKADSDDDGNKAHDSERTDLDDDDENPSLTLKDYDEEEHDEEYEFDDDYENVYEEEDDDLYKDVDVRSLGVKNEKERKALQSYTKEFEKKAQEERKLYIDVVEKSVKDIIKDEVKSLLPQILPKEVLDFATLVIQSTITESLENVVLAKYSSQPQLTYEAAASLTEFELKKILLDKLEKSKSYRAAKEHRNLYDALVKSYQLDKDLFDSYGKAYSLKKSREDKDKDEDPPAGSDQGLKKRKTSKDSMQANEPVFKTADPEMPQDQGDDMGNTEDQPNVKAASKHDYRIAQAEKPPLTFDELMSTPIDFSAYAMQDQTLHKFKEGDFPRLNLRDIEDLLLLLVQKKLSNLENDVIFDLNVALRISDISKMTPYIAYKNPQGIIYQDKLKRNRLMRSDKLYKFCNGTLTSVRRVLHDIASNLNMDYLPKRTWSILDRKRSRIMIKAIDQQLFEKILIRNLEKFVGGREYENDLRLLERTI
ncbi:hypothetical protein Tco_0962448, partial [Tanacetum coccineum]